MKGEFGEIQPPPATTDNERKQLKDVIRQTALLTISLHKTATQVPAV
jgi:hypothetical protein